MQPLTLEHFELRADCPKTPGEVQIFAMDAVPMHEREPAMGVLTDRFKLGRTTHVEAPYGSVFASERGTLQFFAASGGMLARSSAADNAFAEARRPWNRLERQQFEGSTQFTLPKATSDRLVQDTLCMLSSARLMPHADSPLKALPPSVSLDQWGTTADEGHARASAAGAATVHIAYEIDGIPLFGPGARTQGRFEPGDVGDTGELVEMFHAPRSFGHTTQADLEPADAALDRMVQGDRELQQFHSRGHHVRFDALEFGFYALPVFEPQAMLLPVLRVQGTSIHPERPKHEARFRRIVSLLSQRGAAKAGISNDWPATRPVAA